MNSLPVLAKMSVKWQPIMPCGFHAKFGVRVEFPDGVHELEKTCMGVGKFNSLDNDVAISVDNGGFVKAFSNIYADYVHLQHPFGHLL